MQQQQAELDQRAMHLEKLMERAPEEVRAELLEKIEISWIHHENALEGVIYAPEELMAVLGVGGPARPGVVESMSASAFDEVRQNKAAIELIRALAKKPGLVVDADTVREIYAVLAPEEVEGKKPPAFRKDIPLHRLYFHEIAPPDKIAARLKAFGQWLNADDTRRSMHVLRLAAKAHFLLLQIYPYPKHSGKLARLVMNLLLLSAGYPPAVIHSTERQRYYDALKTNENALAQVVKEALTSSIEASIRFFEARLPPPPPEVRVTPMRKRRIERDAIPSDASDAPVARRSERPSGAKSAPPSPTPKADAREAKAADKKAADKKAADKKAADKRAADKRAADKKAADKRAADKRAADKKAADKKAADKRAADKRAADKKAGTRSATRKASAARASVRTTHQAPASVTRAKAKKATSAARAKAKGKPAARPKATRATKPLPRPKARSSRDSRVIKPASRGAAAKAKTRSAA